MAMGHYHFTASWHLDADPATVYKALQDVESYPKWWPQSRAARRMDEQSGELTIRGAIPYDLTITMVNEIEDPDAGILRARLTGDMDGYSQWTIRADGSGTVADFEQDVELRKGLVRRAGMFVRPLLVANHHYVMNHGEKALRAYLS